MSNRPKTSADFMRWESTLSLQHVFSDGESFAYPQLYHDCIIYLTQLKHEQSRTVLMIQRADQSLCFTPDGFSLRTKISEYGGKPFWLLGDKLYFANQSDQCIYCQSLSGVDGLFDDKPPQPQRVTPKPHRTSMLMYADLITLCDGYLAAIVEQENPEEPDSENISYIAGIDPKSPDASLKILESGADFYSDLVIDPKQQRIAWVQWQHPSMPWDDNQAWTARLVNENNEVRLELPQEVRLESPACFCQLAFANNSRLFFSADFSPSFGHGDSASDYWNVFCFDAEQGAAQRVTDRALEFGYPHWQYGDIRIVQHSADKLLTIGSGPDGDMLFEIDQTSLEVTQLDQPPATIQMLASDGHERVAMVRLGKTENPSLVVLDCKSGDERIVKHHSVSLDAVSQAQHIEFAKEAGSKVSDSKAYGFYYPPSNPSYTCDSAPPLLVLVHGGPTARAYGHFDIQKQFWTSRGFALFDVNHHGSTGYGRRYRDALYGQWGELDTADIVAGIETLIEQNKADPQRVCIRGKSAGGYAVLRALTEYPDTFKAGACYYGIGNLTTLAQATHKFEKYYTDRLIDEQYDAEQALSPNSNFYQRSPIHKVSQLKSAMVIFQGLQDNVVPPSVAQEVVAVLEKAGLEHVYVEYSDEGHGFRQVENNIDALSQELAFYRRILSDSASRT